MHRNFALEFSYKIKNGKIIHHNAKQPSQKGMQLITLTKRIAKGGNKTALTAVKKTQVNKSHPKRRLSPCARPRI